jgi:hypothetical protein
MKKIILIVLTLNFLSCGKSIYYVYEYKDKENNSYCTLEITNKKEIIYRATSDYYWANSYPFSNIYIYIYSDKNATSINENRYSFVYGFSELYLIENDIKPKYKYSFIDFGNKPSYSIFYRKDQNDTIVNTARGDFEYLKEGTGFKENGIKWFPPYMVKVDKIDYTKFGKEIQHLNLKKPRK